MAIKKRLLLVLLFGGFFLAALTSGSKVKHQTAVKHSDGSAGAGSTTEESQLQPDIVIRQKGSGSGEEAPLGSFLNQAMQDSSELISKILKNLQPMSMIPQKRMAWKKVKRWAPYKRKGTPFKKRSEKTLKDVERRAQLRSEDRKGSLFRKLNKRYACLTGSLQSGGDNIRRSPAEGERHRCTRSLHFGEMGSEPLASSRYPESSERKAKHSRSQSKRISTYKEEQVLQRRKRRRATEPEKSFFLERPEAQPSHGHDASGSLSSYFTPRAATARKILKRSPPLFHERDENSEEAFLNGLFQKKEEQSSEVTQAGKDLKKREATETKTLPVRMFHLTMTAFKTQEKLSEMIDHISDPSNNMSAEEKLNYMRELLNEMTMFVKLLQQQVAQQSQNEATSSATTSAPQT